MLQLIIVDSRTEDGMAEGLRRETSEPEVLGLNPPKVIMVIDLYA